MLSIILFTIKVDGMSDTSIRVSEELADELHSRKNRGDSYEDVIWRLLENADDYEVEDDI
jgi:predicted CopG family antitoxin